MIDIPKMKAQKFHFFHFFTLLLSTLMASGSASAAEVLQNKLNVSLELVPSCSTVTGATLDFGRQKNQITADITKDAEIKVTCSKYSPYWVSLDMGMYYDGHQRRLRGPDGDYLTYDVYKDPAGQIPWDGSDYPKTQLSTTVDRTGDGTNQTIKVYGRVTQQQTGKPGKYTDSISIAVTY